MTPDPSAIVAAAKIAGHPPVVATATGVYNLIGTWIIAITSVAAFLTALVKFGPKWREAATADKEAEAKILAAAEVRAQSIRDRELTDLNERLRGFEARLQEADNRAVRANERTHVIQMQMVSLNAAIQMVTSELQRLDPDNQVLKQARDLIRLAASNDMGQEERFSRLAARAGEALA